MDLKKGSLISIQERDEIAKGNVSGKTVFRRFGYNDTCGTSFETVWPGSSLYVYLTSAEKLKVASSGAGAGNDVADGTGARTVFIKGLDADYEIQSETITMTGGTAVETSKTYLRFFKAYVVTAGATGYNEGIILIKNNAENNTLGTMPVQEAETHGCLWTVPDGYTAYITSWRGSESSNKGTDVSLWIKTHGGIWRYKRGDYTLDNHFNYKFSIPIKVAAKSDIEVRVKALQDGAKVSSLFRGWYE